MAFRLITGQHRPGKLARALSLVPPRSLASHLITGQHRPEGLVQARLCESLSLPFLTRAQGATTQLPQRLRPAQAVPPSPQHRRVHTDPAAHRHGPLTRPVRLRAARHPLNPPRSRRNRLAEHLPIPPLQQSASRAPQCAIFI